MKQTSTILGNEHGSVIIVVLLVLALMTILGTYGTTNTTLELQIARNDTVHKQHFYRAEAAVNEAAQRIENATVNELSDITDDVWIHQVNRDEIDWTTQSSASLYASTSYSVIDQTGPVDLGAPTNLHTYQIIGRHSQTVGMNSGDVSVIIGYKRRF